MITFSFINLKGGTGKSFLSKHTAYLLAQNGCKVLFIDNDKQGNSSKFFNVKKEEASLADLLLGENTAEEVIQKSQYKNLDVIGGNMRLLDANYRIIKEEREQDTILQKALESIQNEYDFCIIDNPPDINISVFNALVITNEVIIVTNPNEDAMDGVDEMVGQIDIARKYNPNLVFRGCVMNKFVSSTSCYDAKREYPFLRTNIHLATKSLTESLNKSTRERKLIFEISPNSLVARDLKNFMGELLYIKI